MTSDDQIGKIFRAVGTDLRLCLVCQQLFTRRAASEHAAVNCYQVLSLASPENSTPPVART